MLKSKKKGLFVDISEYSILAAITSDYQAPFVIEQVAGFPVEENCSVKDIRSFLGQFADLKKDNCAACCGVYPKDRFVFYQEVDSGLRLKNQSALKKLLQSDLEIKVETNNISILNAHDGSLFDPTKNVSNKLIFCGAPTAELQKTQDQILSFGLLPERLEISSIATLGGLCNYLQLNEFKSSVMYIELALDCMHIFVLNKDKIDMIRSLDFGLNSLFPILKDELKLKDEASAKSLFRSNTFDVAEIGPNLLKKVLKELQAVSGYYEVQTGLNIDKFFMSLLPDNLFWIPNTIINTLGIDLVEIKFGPWLQSLGIELSERINLSELGPQWLGLFSLIADFKSREESMPDE